MKEDIAKRWVEALRSGEYKQGRNQLRKGDAFCCLGVLCDLHAKENGDSWKSEGETGIYMHAVEELPGDVWAWAGLYSSDGSFRSETDYKICLVELNDSGYHSFNQLANIIENEWGDL